MEESFKNAYRKNLRDLNIKLVPMDAKRAKKIFMTVNRAIKNQHEKELKQVLSKLVEIIGNFYLKRKQIFKSQTSFDSWFYTSIKELKKIQFHWSQKKSKEGQQHHKHLTFGLAQKFLSLALKDWWACPNNQVTLKESNLLHGVIDGEIKDAVFRFTRKSKYKIGSPYYNLRKSIYREFQIELSRLGLKLKKSFSLKRAPNRIETEQLIWGWI